MTRLELSPALREHLRAKGVSYIAVDIIDCVS